MSDLKRIIWHWSAGTYEFSESDREHYHFGIDGRGDCHFGEHPPEDNISTSDDDYAAHTKNLNTGSIGLAICGMAGAIERPFRPGHYPIKPVQVDSLVAKTAQLCRMFGISVDRSTVLSHAEVQTTLGVSQDGKWDISWIPGMPAPANPVEVGDQLRLRVLAAMKGPLAPPDISVLEIRVSALEAQMAQLKRGL